MPSLVSNTRVGACPVNPLVPVVNRTPADAIVEAPVVVSVTVALTWVAVAAAQVSRPWSAPLGVTAQPVPSVAHVVVCVSPTGSVTATETWVGGPAMAGLFTLRSARSVPTEPDELTPSPPPMRNWDEVLFQWLLRYEPTVGIVE
jgi:hypothetical protein